MAKFNFLDKISNIDKNEVYILLNKLGKEIYEYAKDYFNYTVTYVNEQDKILNISLYILVPQLKYEYKIISVNYSDTPYHIQLNYFELINNSNKFYEFNISKGYGEFEDKVNEILSSELTNASFRYLVQQVNSINKKKQTYDMASV